MTQDANTRAISGYLLERYAMGELPADTAQKVEARLAADPDLRRQLDALRAHSREFEAAFPAQLMVPRIEAAAAAATAAAAAEAAEAATPNRPVRLARPVRPTWRLPGGFRLAPAWQAAGALAFLLLVAVPAILVLRPAETGETRLKGMRPELRLYRSTPAGPERLVSGASAAAGDVIQIEFHPGGHPYGAIVSVDGKGAVTLHWPPRGDATALSALPENRLPAAFQLDAAPGFERFHLLLSRKPIDLEPMLKLVAASAGRDEAWLASQVPDSVRAVGFTLAK